MAWPMPREAPVTSATSFSSMGTPPCVGTRSAAAMRGRILEREEAQVRAPFDAAIEAGEHLARTALDDLRDAARASARSVCGQRTGLESWRTSSCADVIRLAVRAGIHRAHVADLRRAHGEGAQALAQPLGRARA